MMISGHRKPVQNALSKNSISSHSLRCLRAWRQTECEVHGGIRMNQRGIEDRKRRVAPVEQHGHLRAPKNEAIGPPAREPLRDIDKGLPRRVGDAPKTQLA